MKNFLRRKSKLLILFSFFSSTFLNTFGQIESSIIRHPLSKSESRILFGIRAGYNFCHFGRLETYTSENLGGYTVGTWLQIKNDSTNGIQFELSYSNFGSFLNPPDSLIYKSPSDEINLEYLSLTIMPKIYFSKYVSIGFGVNAGTLLSARENSNLSYLSTSQDIKDNLNSFDIDFLFGFEIHASDAVAFGIRYYYGLFDVFSFSNTFVSPLIPETSFYNRVLQLHSEIAF